MERMKMVIAVGVMVFGLAIVAGVHRKAMAEQIPAISWKWVDANQDCVSSCDNKTFNCPCVITSP